jgi:hypothetical protein
VIDEGFLKHYCGGQLTAIDRMVEWLRAEPG